MTEIKIFHDSTGNTLTVWFGNPEDEVEAEETGDDLILMKDRAGTVIDLEKPNFSAQPVRVAFKTLDSKQTRKVRSPGLTSGSVDDAFFEPMSEEALQQWESSPVFPPE